MFNNPAEVKAFFQRFGVEVLNVGTEGDCIAAEVRSEADIEIMRNSGLEIVDTRRNSGKLAVVFYPNKPSNF